MISSATQHRRTALTPAHGAARQSDPAVTLQPVASGHWLDRALVVVAVVAVALRLWAMLALPWEQDELYSVIEGRELWQSPIHPSIHGRPLFFLLMHPLIVALPHSPALLRIVPVALALAGLWVTWLLARRLFDRTGALVTLAVVALSPWHLYMSGFFRYWALVYLLAALVYLLLPAAYDSDRPRDYLRALVPLCLGSITHPTFAFPMVGVALALTVVSRDGTLGWHWPTRNAWKALWGPYLGWIAAFYAFLKITGSEGALRNWGGRGLLSTLRLVPAILEWLTPTIVVAALLGAGLAFVSGRAEHRRWAAMTVLGLVVAFPALLAAAFLTDVYADYFTAALPLVFVSLGALAKIGGEALAPSWRRGLAAMTAVVLVTAQAPGTASYLSDGMRFDYRPAITRTQKQAPEWLVLGWPKIMMQEYAPPSRFEEIRARRRWLDSVLVAEGQVWAIPSVKRHGIALDDKGIIGGWLNDRCRVVETFEKPRFDFRMYRVELYRCTAPGVTPTVLQPPR